MPLVPIFACQLIMLQREKILFLVLTYETLRLLGFPSRLEMKTIFIQPNKLVRHACYAKCPNMEVN